MSIRTIILFLFLILTGAACTSGGGRTASVTVTNNSGAKLAGVTVVLGDSDGAMKATGVTNAHGIATFSEAPANATVTTAYTCLYSGSTYTYYSLDVQYDVNEPVTLAVNDCSIIPGSGSSTTDSIGTITVNITTALSGTTITQNELMMNGLYWSGLPAVVSQLTLTIYPYQLQDDGKLSIYVLGRDANGLAVGYGMIQGQTFTDGMTMNIAVDKPVSFVQYHLTNLPVGAGFLCTNLDQTRSGKGEVWIIDCRELSSSSSTTTIAVAYIPGVGDQFQYSVDAFVDSSNGNVWVSSSQYLALAPSTLLSDQSIDFSQALAAPSGLSVAGSDTVTPELIWTGLDPAAEASYLFASFRLTSGSFVYLDIDNLSTARTSIKFPELPDSLAAFRPQGVGSFSIGSFASSNGSFRSSFSNFSTYFNALAPAPMRDAPGAPQLQFLQRKGLPVPYLRHSTL